jgi:hypothetical protein
VPGNSFVALNAAIYDKWIRSVNNYGGLNVLTRGSQRAKARVASSIFGGLMNDEPPAPLDQDDGAIEVVDRRPARSAGPVFDVKTIALQPAGGRLASARSHPEERDNFITMRTPMGAAKIAFTHAATFNSLWRAWTAKRTRGEADAGVTVSEITAIEGLPLHEVNAALRSLTRNRVVTVITQHIGYQGTRARYYPTEIGIQAFALAEVLGAGSLIQIGRTSRAWRGRDRDEPADLFQFAALLRGGSIPADEAL